MKIRSLLLGSAMTLFAVSGALASSPLAVADAHNDYFGEKSIAISILKPLRARGVDKIADVIIEFKRGYIVSQMDFGTVPYNSDILSEMGEDVAMSLPITDAFDIKASGRFIEQWRFSDLPIAATIHIDTATEFNQGALLTG